MDLLLPNRFHSTALGITWGMSMAECYLAFEAASVLHRTRTEQLEKWAQHQFSIDGETWYGQLYGHDVAGLMAVRIYLHVTQDFWNRKLGEVSEDQSHAEWKAAVDSSFAAYEKAIGEWGATLGPPIWSGHQHIPGYPRDQWAWHLAYWDMTPDRLQIEVQHEDSEFPLIVALACYPLPNHARR